MENIYVKCSREKEEIFRQKSVKLWKNRVVFSCYYYLLDRKQTLPSCCRRAQNISSSCDMLKPLQLSQTAICIDGAQYFSGCHSWMT